MSASKACINRLQKEYRAVLKEPVPSIKAHPSPSNILEWHYALEGSPNTEYEGGVYHGKVVFSPHYPYKPPSILMLTPSGRFAIQQKLCLSISDFHPESWNPMWSVGTILTGLLSFMNETAHTTGSISSTKAEKRRFAKMSLEYNLKNPMFRKLFPEYQEELRRRQLEEEERAKQNCENGAGATPEPSKRPQAPATASSMLITTAIVLVMAAILAVPFLAQASGSEAIT